MAADGTVFLHIATDKSEAQKQLAALDVAMKKEVTHLDKLRASLKNLDKDQNAHGETLRKSLDLATTEIQQQEEKLAKLKQKQADMSGGKTADDPVVTKLVQSITNAEARLAKLQAKKQEALSGGALVTDESLVNLQSQIDNATQRLEALSAKKDMALNGVPANDPALSKLEAQITKAQGNLDTLQDKSAKTQKELSGLGANTELKRTGLQKDIADTEKRLVSLSSSARSAMGGLKNSIFGMVKAFASVAGAVLSLKLIVDFGKDSVEAAREAGSAWQGLQSIVEGQGRSFANAKGYINEYIDDGLVPLKYAVTAYKNLAARGYSDVQIQQTMTAL